MTPITMPCLAMKWCCLPLLLLIFCVRCTTALDHDASAAPWSAGKDTGDDINPHFSSLPGADFGPQQERVTKIQRKTIKVMLPLLAGIVALSLGLMLAKKFPPGYFSHNEEERQAYRFLEKNASLVYKTLLPVYDISGELNYSDLWKIVEADGKALLEAQQGVLGKVGKGELPQGSVPLNELVCAVKGYLLHSDRLKPKVRSDLKGICGLYYRGGRPQGVVEAARYHIGVLRSLAPSCINRELKLTEFSRLIKSILYNLRACEGKNYDVLEVQIAIGYYVRRMMTRVFVRNIAASKLEQVKLEKKSFDLSKQALQEFLAEFIETRKDLEIKDISREISQAMEQEFHIAVNAQVTYQQINAHYIVPEFKALLLFSERVLACNIIERLLTMNNLIVYKPRPPS